MPSYRRIVCGLSAMENIQQTKRTFNQSDTTCEWFLYLNQYGCISPPMFNKQVNSASMSTLQHKISLILFQWVFSFFRVPGMGNKYSA